MLVCGISDKSVAMRYVGLCRAYIIFEFFAPSTPSYFQCASAWWLPFSSVQWIHACCAQCLCLVWHHHLRCPSPKLINEFKLPYSCPLNNYWIFAIYWSSRIVVLKLHSIWTRNSDGLKLTSPTSHGLPASPSKWEKRIWTASAVERREGMIMYYKQKILLEK